MLGVGHANLTARNVVAANIAARVFAKTTPVRKPAVTPLGPRPAAPPAAAARSEPPPLAANAFTSEPARAHPFADLHTAIPPQPLAPDAWTTPTPETIDDAEPTRPHKTSWLTRARSTIGGPFNALATVIARVDHDAHVLRRRTQRSWRRMRSELALLALRTHGIVVHKTRGRLGAILLAFAPVLLLSLVAAVWFANRAPVTQASAPVEVIPTEADIARILRSRTGFTVMTEPAGARVYVDGRSTNRITPERVSGFAPGLHSIELKMTGYYDTNLAAVLEEGSTLVLPPVILTPLPQEHFDPAEQ